MFTLFFFAKTISSKPPFITTCKVFLFMIRIFWRILSFSSARVGRLLRWRTQTVKKLFSLTNVFLKLLQIDVDMSASNWNEICQQIYLYDDEVSVFHYSMGWHQRRPHEDFSEMSTSFWFKRISVHFGWRAV